MHHIILALDKMFHEHAFTVILINIIMVGFNILLIMIWNFSIINNVLPLRPYRNRDFEIVNYRQHCFFMMLW